MSRQIQMRRGTANEHSNFIGAIGEITIDTDNKTIRVHDGETVGGTPLARQSEIPQPSELCKASMPGNYIIDLFVEAPDTLYTAPADGYVYLVVSATAPNNYARILANGFGLEQRAVATDNWLRIMMPIQAGATYRLEYSSDAIVKYFKFIYCQSAQ